MFSRHEISLEEGLGKMVTDNEQKLLKPIINACYPGTLMALTLAVLEVTEPEAQFLRLNLSITSLMFLLSTIFIFFYSLYPRKRWLWTSTALMFILGLFGSLISVIMLIIVNST